MSYKDAYHPRVKADLKKLDNIAVKEIHTTHLDILLHNPFNGECLYGNLEGIFSYHFRKNKVDYRIAYTVDDESKIVYIIMIGKRANFYEALKRRLS